MIAQSGGTPPWEELLSEIRRLRRDVDRAEEQMWQAVEDLHELVRDGQDDRPRHGNGPGPEGAGQKGREYRSLKRRFRRFVERTVPAGSRVAIVSRGDPDLLDLPSLAAKHFPRDVDGGYSGFYPNDGTAAIAHLQWVRAVGAEYLVLPQTSRWWLDSFPRFADHVRARYPVVADESGVGLIFHLQADSQVGSAWPDRLDALLDAWESVSDGAPSILDWNTGLDMAGHLSGRSVFSPPGDASHLPYVNRTVDVVAISADDPRRLEEAMRVARRSVVRCGSSVVIEHVDGPPPALPSVSIIIPTYNGIDHLTPCLRALRETLPVDFNGEVLVIDDGSGPDTVNGLSALERDLSWLTVLRNEANLGFIGSCNRGAEEAEGDVLVFLNDDTVPLPGWLQALLMTFRTRPDAGAVGGRLIYPDGRLQEAGCLLYRDGSGANVGRDDHEPDAPLYRHVRAVDYCSGALLATPRDLFLSLGGFDPRYRPAYYEDSDYCLSVGAEGLKVYYQPESTIVHTEGATSGTDPSAGAKRYQARNRTEFLRKWRTELALRPDPPSEYSPLVWHRLVLGGVS